MEAMENRHSGYTTFGIALHRSALAAEWDCQLLASFWDTLKRQPRVGTLIWIPTRYAAHPILLARPLLTLCEWTTGLKTKVYIQV
jgi:hypothetical protein